MTPFLHVQANDLISWFTTTILARTKLSVLLRTLVHSTGGGLCKVDFPIRLGNADMASRVLTDEENIQLRIELIGRATVREWELQVRDYPSK